MIAEHELLIDSLYVWESDIDAGKEMDSPRFLIRQPLSFNIYFELIYDLNHYSYHLFIIQVYVIDMYAFTFTAKGNVTYTSTYTPTGMSAIPVINKIQNEYSSLV